MKHLILAATLLAASPAVALEVHIVRGVDPWRPHCVARCIVDSFDVPNWGGAVTEPHDNQSAEFREYVNRHLFQPQSALDEKFEGRVVNDRRLRVFTAVLADHFGITPRALLDELKAKHQALYPAKPTPAPVPAATPTP